MKNQLEKLIKTSNGITLIALVVTIIVLLILAGILIQMLTGDNGIIQRAGEEKVIQDKAEIIEQAKMDILAQIAENKGETLSNIQFKNILIKYFKEDDIPNRFPKDLSILELTTLNNKYKILASEIYTGNIIEAPLTIGDVMEVGDWVEYISDESEYTTTESEIGVVQTLNTDKTTKWRVWKIEDDKVIIIPSSPINSLELYGVMGYINGSETINKVCKKLYTNISLGVKEIDIRSMNLDDIEYATGENRENTKYTSGPSGTYVFNEILEFTSGKFFTYEENEKTITNSEPNEASSENPVKVRNTTVYVDKNYNNWQWKSIENKKIGTTSYGEMIGVTYGWLSDPCTFFKKSVKASPPRVDYGLHAVKGLSGVNINGGIMVNSNGTGKSGTYGLRPLIYLNEKLFIDGSYSDRDGKSESTAWKITNQTN